MGRIDMVMKTTDENEKLRRRIQELTADYEQHCHQINRLYEQLQDIRNVAQDGIGEFLVFSNSNLLPDIFNAIEWKNKRIQELEDALRPFAEAYHKTRNAYEITDHINRIDLELAAEVLGKTAEREGQ